MSTASRSVMGVMQAQVSGSSKAMSSATTGRRVLVTGATGLLGSHIVERLIAQGYTVRALVRPSSRTAFLDEIGIDVRRGDLTDPASCERALDDVALVFHCAAK